MEEHKESLASELLHEIKAQSKLKKWHSLSRCRRCDERRID